MDKKKVSEKDKRHWQWTGDGAVIKDPDVLLYILNLRKKIKDED